MRSKSKRKRLNALKKQMAKNFNSKYRTVPPALSEHLIKSDNIIRLKVTVRKGARIESVPLKKLERLTNRKKLRWKYDDGWLILYSQH